MINDSTVRLPETHGVGLMTYKDYMPSLPKAIEGESSLESLALVEEGDTLEDPTPPPPPEEEEEA